MCQEDCQAYDARSSKLVGSISNSLLFIWEIRSLSQTAAEMASSSNETMRLGLSEPLRVLVQRKFARARTSRDLLFSDTELSILRSRQGVHFQLRFCEALSAKPKEKVPDWSKPKSKVDPFEEPSPELLLAGIPRHDISHNLVLNKFPVIPNHFIIATKANKPQTDILEESDLATTYACLRAWEADSKGNEDGDLFAFFNSGDHSGASQVHRHLQFLPSRDMMFGSDPDYHWSLLIRSMTSQAHSRSPLLYNPALPFVHFALRLESNVSPASLYTSYLTLMRAALSAAMSRARGTRGEDFEKVEIERNGRTTFSYNLALTTDMMAICPRRSESAQIPGLDESHDVSINGTILAGTLMVKNVKEWEALRHNPHVLDDILEEIGYPWPSEQVEHFNGRL